MKLPVRKVRGQAGRAGARLGISLAWKSSDELRARLDRGLERSNVVKNAQIRDLRIAIPDLYLLPDLYNRLIAFKT
jgi:hypothetical protein